MPKAIFKGVALVIGVMSFAAMRQVMKAPSTVLHGVSHMVHLPFQEAGPGWAAIERAALKATRGGQIQSIRPSLWTGKPVWMCTVSQGRTVWHVMVSRASLHALSKIVVLRH